MFNICGFHEKSQCLLKTYNENTPIFVDFMRKHYVYHMWISREITMFLFKTYN